ncbi:unnamed protein product [Caenorhabditis sp. 36 PRJEB53466]|nr:unnamed protein product [Caenorhabditis sp. 36 PRJEB53466]
MFQYILSAVALICFVQVIVAENYGVPEEYKEGYEAAPSNSYGAAPKYPGDYDHDDDDHHRRCRHLRQFNIAGQNTPRASFSDFERKGRNYIKITCPNNNRPYALVTEKDGADTIIGGVNLDNTVLLASGFNVAFVAECRHGKRVAGKAVDGERHHIRKVACVLLSQPSAITAL